MTPRSHLLEVAAWWALLILAFSVFWFLAATRRPLPLVPPREEVKASERGSLDAFESDPHANEGETP